MGTVTLDHHRKENEKLICDYPDDDADDDDDDEDHDELPHDGRLPCNANAAQHRWGASWKQAHRLAPMCNTAMSGKRNMCAARAAQRQQMGFPINHWISR